MKKLTSILNFLGSIILSVLCGILIAVGYNYYIYNKDATIKELCKKNLFCNYKKEISESFAKKTFKRKHNTVVHKMLDQEIVVYNVRQEHYNKVDIFLDKVIEHEKDYKKIFDYDNVKYDSTVFYYSSMYNIGQTMEKEFNLNCCLVKDSIKLSTIGENLIGRGLDSNYLDCDLRSAFYLAAAEVLHKKLIAVKINGLFSKVGHIFVRWYKDEKYSNWETWSLSCISDNIYREEWKKDKTPFEEFQELNNSQFLETWENSSLLKEMSKL